MSRDSIYAIIMHRHTFLSLRIYCRILKADIDPLIVPPLGTGNFKHDRIIFKLSYLETKKYVNILRIFTYF